MPHSILLVENLCGSGFTVDILDGATLFFVILPYFGVSMSDLGFIFNFGDNSVAEESFSFFGGGGGDAKSSDKEEKNDNFFLNFDGGEGDKEEEGSGWNFLS